MEFGRVVDMSPCVVSVVGTGPGDGPLVGLRPQRVVA